MSTTLVRFPVRAASSAPPFPSSRSGGVALVPGPCVPVLYEEFQPLVRGLLRRYGKVRELREDLGGELYAQFHRFATEYDPCRGIPFRAYVVRRLQHAAFNYARDYWRKQSHTVSLDDERWLEKQLVEDQESEWIERLDAERARALLPGLIAKLPPRQRKVLIARFYEEAAFEDIAVQMQIQPSSVRSLLRHGIHALRCELRQVGYLC